MDKIKHARMEDIPVRHKCEHEAYEYYRRDFVAREDGKGCMVSLYEIPPGKAPCPYHYHHKSEETFYILRGQGLLKTPEGERTVSAGDFLFFPSNPNGAHKLINTSETEMLVYLDFDTLSDLDVVVYSDSKVGVWGKYISKMYSIDNTVEYYDGE